MIKLAITALLLVSSLAAGNLSFESGSIKAHTEVFGDATIDPMSKKATSHLSMDGSPITLKGSIEVSLSDLFSDNKKRDEHMQESLESSLFPKAIFDVKEVVANEKDGHALKGIMTLHGVSKAMSFKGTISEVENKVHIKAQSIIKMTDFGIKPIKMVFITVRDQIDLSVDVVLKR
jgi:polyisoprenoid-binding protein YceI